MSSTPQVDSELSTYPLLVLLLLPGTDRRLLRADVHSGCACLASKATRASRCPASGTAVCRISQSKQTLLHHEVQKGLPHPWTSSSVSGYEVEPSHFLLSWSPRQSSGQKAQESGCVSTNVSASALTLVSEGVCDEQLGDTRKRTALVKSTEQGGQCLYHTTILCTLKGVHTILRTLSNFPWGWSS